MIRSFAVRSFAVAAAVFAGLAASGEPARSAPVPHDFSLPSGSTTIPFELVDNHVDLPVTINGKGPFHFIFDTGGANYIDSSLAMELGIKATGKGTGFGVGTGTEAIQFGKVETLQVGDATLHDQTFVVGPVRDGFGVSSGKPVDGLIGFEVLSRFVTTFDYGKNEIVLRAPGSAPPPGGTTIPFVFNHRHVEIPCTVNAFAGRCTVDTGSRLSNTVLSPFLAAHPSIVPPNATAIGADGFGIGGTALGRLGRTTLQIGAFAIPDVITDLSTQTKGAFADPHVAANIGAGTWKRFAVTFDYAKQTMTLEPNANYGARETYDRSGTFLINRDGKIVVVDVRPGTAAADAGLAKGDVLAAVDDKDAAGMGLAAIRDAFRGPAGSVIALAFIAKDGSEKTTALTLRDYV
jgi:Aspartyl protease/PDZ domain